MQDYTFGLTPNLPPPDQSTGNISTPGQPVGPAGTPTTTGSKNVGGSTSGVDASKGAITSTGANSLIVDQGVESSITTGISSDTNLENPEHVFSTSEMNFVGSQTQIETLGKEIDILNETGPTFGLASLAVTSALKDTISSSSAAGKTKGDEGTRTEKGERRDDGKKAEGKGKGKGTAEEASPSAGDSVSRAVSPTGEVTTTVSTESVSTSGSMTTNTTTTVSGGSSSSSQGSTSSTGTESAPPPQGTISMTQIMDEIGGLEGQESATMAQQQTSEIDAIELQAKDSIAGADKLMQGAAMMMTMATVGLAVSMSTSAYQMGGIASASKEGDQAEMQSLNEHQESLETTSQSSIESMGIAKDNPASVEAPVNAQKSASQLRTLANDKKTPQNIQDQATTVANNVDKASLNATYKAGGTKAGLKYEDSDACKQAQIDLAAAKKAGTVDPNTTIDTPEDAVKFYSNEAITSHNTLKESISNYKTALSGKTVSDDAAKSAIYESWPKDKQAEYDAKDDAGKSAMIDGPATEYKTSIANVKINRNSSAWNQAYQNRSQQIQIYAGTGQSLAQVFNQAGSMEEQIGNAQQQKLQAAAQVQGSTEQAMAQGVQQTQSLAEQFRQSQSAVAQDMSSMVSSTRV